MAKRKTARRGKRVPAGKTKKSKARSARRPTSRVAKRSARKPAKKKVAAKAPVKSAKLSRARRTLQDADVVPTPPSSLNMNRRGTAARSGRAGLDHSLEEHGDMTPALTGGDVDADWENAYFSGDEAPGGDNPTPDQEVVDDIGKALGVQYEDNEELKSGDKVKARDKHRWELDPASSEDYKERKR